MPVIPRKGQTERREQAAASRKQQVEDMTMQQRLQHQQMEMQRRHYEMQMRAQRQAVAPMSYEERRAQRRKDMLTDEEVSEGVEDGSQHGKTFRMFFIGLVAVIILFLFFLKVDSETGIELPEHVKRLSYTAQGVGSDDKEGSKDPARQAPATATDLPEKEQALLDKYLEELNVKKPKSAPKKAEPTADTEEAKTDDNDSTITDSDIETPEQRIKRRRREDYEFKKQLKEAHSSKMEEQNALTTCGKACQDKYGAMQLQYDQINQQVTNELWSVVSENEDDAEAARESPTFVNPHKLKKTVEAKIKKLEEEKVEEGTEAHLDQQLAIQEIKDTYAILANEESRRYYALTGKKPPPAMSKVSARAGGWGQELILRTHYHKLILTWLQFLENSRVDTFTIVFVFVCLFLGPALARLPQTVAMAQRMADEWEQAAEMQKKMKQQ